MAVDATGGTIVMPAELTLERMGEWQSSAEFRAAKRAWLRAHGIDPADWSAVYPVLCMSRRAHAVFVRDLDSLARARRRAEGADPDDRA